MSNSSKHTDIEQQFAADVEAQTQALDGMTLHRLDALSSTQPKTQSRWTLASVPLVGAAMYLIASTFWATHSYAIEPLPVIDDATFEMAYRLVNEAESSDVVVTTITSDVDIKLMQYMIENERGLTNEK